MSTLDFCSFSIFRTSPPYCFLPRAFPTFLSPPCCFSNSTFSHSERRLPLNLVRRASLPSAGNLTCQCGPEVEEFEEDAIEIEDFDREEEEVDDEAYSFDTEVLEEEAKVAVKEFSRSLSRQLKIEDEKNDKKSIHERKSKRKSAIGNIPDRFLPKVAIVGRPNVGKSALFNRLVGGNKAIVVDEPGVTRDRLYGRSFWGEYEFVVVDTGGVLTMSKYLGDVVEELAITTTIGMEGIPLATREAAVAKMPSMIERQASVAMDESSVIIFLVDGQVPMSYFEFQNVVVI